MNTNYKQIKNYISSIKRYQIESEDKISINYKLLNEDINNIEKDLISSLLKDKLCKELFFDKIEDIYVFNQNKFIEVMFNTNEYMEGSYTKYDNKIGLFLKDEDKIQLNFPYKDCVLVGGMDKEDDKVNLEIFYNEILERDKINKLFEPKVFHNIKKYSYDKELAQDDKLDNPNNIQVDNDIDTIEFETIIDENGVEKEKLKDNLLIKGNNLLGLHSLARRLSGSIDVIYIDPPYYFNKTKSSDSFAYNSNFKLSTWLTFMKNRLEVARELLSNTGVIFISMNEDGNSYLKLLCDDIFGVDNFVENFSWKKTNTPQNIGIKTRSNIDYILCYEKNKSTLKYSSTKEGGNDTAPLLLKDAKESILIFNTEDILFKEKIIGKTIKKGILGKNKNNKNNMELLEDYEIGRTQQLKLKARFRWNQEYLDKQIKKGTKLFCNTEELAIRYKKNSYDNVLPTTLLDSNDNYGTNEEGTSILVDLNLDLFKNPKPISVIKNLIFMITYNNKNSTILDFFAGSGTTAHSVLSLNKEDSGNRKFILLEQMDYIENITAERIRRSMIKEEYEDSFVYMEMKESDTKELKNFIKLVSNKKELISLINDNFNNGYFINIDNKEQLLLKIEEIHSKATKKSNPLNDSIKLVIEKHMDNNLDYVSYEDIEELKQSNQIKENEYKLNKLFYEGI